ncbi:hypothetical protein ACJO1P_05380 [Vibrio parahaemolyticus]|uniref:hypothetical protein n=1 Tax=Vibrio parahaemolyticus TaxID=670 RepID=UPI00387B4A68
MLNKFFSSKSDCEQPTIDFGICRYDTIRKRSLYDSLFCKKSKTWKLPIRLFDRGLFIIGDSWGNSGRVTFTNAYAKTLLDYGARVIYITESLSGLNSDSKGNEILENMHEQIGFKNLQHDEVLISELSGEFDPKTFDKGLKLSIIKTNPGWQYKDDMAKGLYNTKLISLLNKIAESGIASHDTPLNKREVVVILEESQPLNESTRDELEKAMCWLKGKGFGLVVSTDDTRRYRGIVNSFGHYALFRMDDPYEEMCSHNFLRRDNSHSCSGLNQYVTRIDSRDIKSLRKHDCFFVSRLKDNTDVNMFFVMLDSDKLS